MNSTGKNETELREHFEAEVGQINWKEIERFFASGTVIEIDTALDLVDVAVTATMDNSLLLKKWLEEGLIRHLNDETAIDLSATNASFNGVVVRPWVFVQIGKRY